MNPVRVVVAFTAGGTRARRSLDRWDRMVRLKGIIGERNFQQAYAELLRSPVGADGPALDILRSLIAIAPGPQTELEELAAAMTRVIAGQLDAMRKAAPWFRNVVASATKDAPSTVTITLVRRRDRVRLLLRFRRVGEHEVEADVLQHGLEARHAELSGDVERDVAARCDHVEVEGSVDGKTWQSYWLDWTGGVSLRGALEHPREVPIRLVLPDVRVRIASS